MARPASLKDVKDAIPEEVTIATVYLDKFANQGSLLRAYGTFMEAVERAGCVVEVQYGSNVTITRPASKAEKDKALRVAQAEWDKHQSYYDTWASGEELKQEYQYNYARQHAEAEGLPVFPWDQYGKESTESAE